MEITEEMVPKIVKDEVAKESSIEKIAKELFELQQKRVAR